MSARQSAGEVAAIGQPIVDLDELDASSEFRAVVAALHERNASVGGLWGSSQALVLAALVRRAQGPWFVLVSNEAEAESFAADLSAFGAEPTVFPARESHAGRSPGAADAEAVRRRLQVAQRLSGPQGSRPRLIVASLLSALQPVPSPEQLAGDYLHLQVGGRLDTEGLLERLVAAGFARTPLAEHPGEVSLRGDILDLFAFAAELPLRVELFGDEIESLRTFDPDSQRSVESSSRVSICIASDVGGIDDGRGAPPASLLATTCVLVRVEPLRIQDQLEGLRIRSSAHARALVQFDQAMARHRRLELQSLPSSALDFRTGSVQALSVGMQRACDALREAATGGARVRVLCRTEAEEHRTAELLSEHGGIDGVETRLGSVLRGFRLPALGLALVNHRELAGVEGTRHAAKKPTHHRVRALQSFFELRMGDLVVHAVHGVALFQGLALMPRGEGTEEHLHLLFAGDVSLFVPASRIDLVQRYVGSGSKAPGLDTIGGTSFKKRKEKVERALYDLAADLLEVQALRETRKRPPWRPDAELVRDMIAAFPFTDTADQVTADRDIAADLSGPRPMDRLLCGDVGFGKTELAIRAAFRVVSSGSQVAVLVPTTVLAEQHGRTFAERLADFPLEVRVLSRYTSGAEKREALAGIADGRVDVAIGTHRILSKDVRFQRLGLVIVDEEQRFGVTHKEHFKRLRATIDILTLSATPIPRTLHMSLSGVRDISALSIPPDGRLDIETVIAYGDDLELVRDALVRERARGGQVFFLHNTVHSIEAFARALRELVPECSFAVGHGQMPGHELARVMDAFIHGHIDVLVSTTIVENGIDIPSAGTILIDRADTFGLAELHQLRGRVGRGSQKSYCYLLVDRNRPMAEVARERLKALEEMSHLGAGFGISMKDLELRGAGNILGPEQSGHIAAIGYDMYCRLLKQTIERVRAGGSAPAPERRSAASSPNEIELELGLAAYLPRQWIPSAKTRLELLRALDAIHSEKDAQDAASMLRDRYGRMPDEAAMLIRVMRLRARLCAVGITRLSWRGDTYLVDFEDRVAIEAAFLGRGIELRPLESGRALLVLPAERTSAETALEWLEELLQLGPAPSKMSSAGA